MYGRGFVDNIIFFNFFMTEQQFLTYKSHDRNNKLFPK